MPPTPRLGRAPPAFGSRRVGCDADRLFSCPFRCAKHSAPSRDASSRFALDLARQARQRLIDAGVIIEHKPEPAPDDQPEAEPEERGVAADKWSDERLGDLIRQMREAMDELP